MDIFKILTFIGGLSLFLFGMSVMGNSLEKKAGNKLKTIIGKLTNNRFIGLLIGTVTTAIIQSSSATTVLVVGLVNSNIMTLGQAIYVIMGANIGTTITSWILSLSGISSSNIFIQLLKPSSFTPILALIGVVLYLFFKSENKKEIGTILLGFAVLMFGMETMSSSVSALKEVEWFRNLFIAFESNPLLGVLAGLGVTAVIQSSSASVGILQAFATTGQITFGAAIPIILGQNIGTCATSMISSIGANKNAKRASMVHLLFNVIGTLVFLIAYLFIRWVFKPAILQESASLTGIALFHTVFNIVSVIIMLPLGKVLEKLVTLIIKDKKDNVSPELDDRLLATPSIALEQAKSKIIEMAGEVRIALDLSSSLKESNFAKISMHEDRTDELEDVVSSYLVKLSSGQVDEDISIRIAAYLKVLNDYERIADYFVNIARIKNNMENGDLTFSKKAEQELDILESALNDMWSLSYKTLVDEDVESGYKSAALEEVISSLCVEIREHHIKRLQEEKCTFKNGICLLEMLNNIERVAGHCTNVSGYIIDLSKHNMNSHENLEETIRTNSTYLESLEEYRKHYVLK